MADNTFLGLQPYTEDDAYRFKGRTEESQELFRLIVRNDFTVCYAESGEGKTSLLNAGVFPLLRENMYFPIAITFTSDDYKVTPDSFDAIIDRCIKDSIADYNEKNNGVNVEYLLCSTDFQGLDCQAGLQRVISKYSWWKLRNYRPQAMGLAFTPVFVFDQFEEVFNLPGSIVWTKKFFDWLEDVSSDSCPDVIAKKVREIIGDKSAFPTIKEEKGFKAVFSLRKEFIGELDYWGMQTHFIPALKDNRYCLKALTYEGAKKVMTQQERFDEDKVEQVLTHFVGQYSREPERTISENLPAIPALLLSIVCDSWEKDIDAFTAIETDEIGQSLNNNLERFYNQAIDSVVVYLCNIDTNLISDQCRFDIDTAIFALVDGNGKRVRLKTTASPLTQIDFDTKFKMVLSDNRLIKMSKVDGEDYVEIVHDCLCPIIAKKKEARLAKDAIAREIHKNREKKRKILKRWLFGASCFIMLLCVLTVASFWRINSKIRMNESRTLAEKISTLVDDGDSYLARLLALEALPPYRPYTVEAENALRNASSFESVIIREHTGSIYSASFSSDGKRIVSALSDSTIRIWDATTGQQISEPLKGYTSREKSATFSPDGRRIVSASSDSTIRIWNATTGQQIGKPLKGHTGWVYSASFCPDGKRIVSASNDSTIRIWNATTGQPIGEPLKGHTDWVSSATFSPDGKRIVSASWDNTIRIWDATTGQLIGEPLKGHTNYVNSATFSPDGKRIVSASYDRTIRIWNAITGQQIGELTGHTGIVETATFSPDGKRIVSASSDNTIRIWDAITGQLTCELTGHTDDVISAAFSPDGKRIVSASEDGTVHIWDVAIERQVVKRLQGGTRAVFSSDGKNIVAGTKIYDADTGHKKCEIKENSERILSSVFSPDGKRIVSISNDRTARIWDANTGEQIGEPLEGHTGSVFSAVFSPDGKRIVSASDDRTIRIWDAQTGKQIGPPLEGHTGGVYSAAFSPDGKHIVSASYDKTIRIWNFPSLQELIDSTRERFKNRQLTPEERHKYYLE